MHLKILSIKDVAELHLCSGCGVCAHLDPEQVEMVDDLEAGRRPLVQMVPKMTSAHAAAFAACPGRHLAHDYDRTQPGLIRALEPAWGPVLGVWEGFAGDQELRFAGSSGGAASALSAFAMEQQGYAGTLHIAARKDVPYLNETVLSTTREELLERTGSRYAPASPCDGLGLVERTDGPCVFIGKPCDVAATHKARKHRPTLDQKLGLTIAIFCAGTPSTRGTLEMLRQMGIDPDHLEDVRYRGNGWPGEATATAASGKRSSMTYEHSWGEILTRHVQWRCRLCPDHTGEFADIAVGDPWHTPPSPGDAGRSLVVARSRRGREIIEKAIAAGYLTLAPVDPKLLPRSQPNLLRARGSVWGRLFALHCAGVPTPSYSRLPMFKHWLATLPMKEKTRSVVGTFSRIGRRGLRTRRPTVPFHPVVAAKRGSVLTDVMY